MSIRMESMVVANCRPEHVWQTFSQTAAWPSWNPVIGRADWLAGTPWQEGSKIRIEIVNPITFSLEPSIKSCDPPGWVHFSGGGMATQGEMAFSFEPQQDGTTLLRARSQVSGPAMLFVTDRIVSQIKRVFDDWLDALKAEAEKQAMGPNFPFQ